MMSNILLATAHTHIWTALSRVAALGAVTDSRLILIPLLLTLLAGGFWLWMAWDFGGNSDIVGDERLYWIVAFILLNVFAAVFYYVNVYRRRH